MSPTPREERLAKNEALFRVANERMARWEERHGEDEAELYYCECADPECRKQVPVVGQDYERIRANPRLFFVAPGHEIPDVETVVERHDEWAVVEKPGDVDQVIDPLDPRGPR
jgi:hypothetical protein